MYKLRMSPYKVSELFVFYFHENMLIWLCRVTCISRFDGTCHFDELTYCLLENLRRENDTLSYCL